MKAASYRASWGACSRLVGGLSLTLLLGSCSALREGLEDEDGGSLLPGDAGSNADGAANGNVGPGLGLGDGGAVDKGAGAALCGDFRIPADTQTPEVLIVLDRSGSMRTLLVDRWGPSSSAVQSIVQSLEPTVHFGLMLFPGDCTTIVDPNEQLACLARLGGLDQSLSCEPGRIDVPIAAGPTAIGSALQKTQPGGATPTAASIDSASKALLALPAHPGEGAKLILLVTDGAPNCSLGLGGLLAVGAASSNGQPEAVGQAVAAIQRADSAGVRTYVIGYDTDSDEFLRTSLDQMAQVGGTGDSTHRKVEDQASLVQTLQDLTQKTLLCELRLEQPLSDPSRLRVVLAGQPVANDPVNGFALGADQQTVLLRGASCDALRTGHGAVTAQAQILCPEPPPPPPPPVVIPEPTPDAGGPGDALDAGPPEPPPPLYI